MIEKNLRGLSPVRLRMILILSMVLVIVASGVGFWFFRGWLANFATEVSQEAKQAELTSNEVTKLQNIQSDLTKNAVAVKRAQNIVANSEAYEYQSKIISDIDEYARKTGIKVTGYTFDSGLAGSTSNPNASESPNPTGGATTAMSAAPAGVKKVTVNLDIASPVKYTSFMNFIRAIETSLTKMQLTGVGMSQDAGNDKDNISIDPISIEVYVK